MDRRGFIKGAGQLTVAGAVATAMHPARALIGMLGGSAAPITFIPIGVNYAAGGGSALSFESLPMFKNRVREGRGFTTAGSYNSTQVALSSAGWPTTDFSLVPWEGGTAPSWLTAATLSNPMKGYFIGSGSEAITGTGCTIGTIVHGTGGAYTTFDCYGITGTFRIDITGTTGGATNVALYIAGYDLGGIDDVTQKSAYFPPALTLYGALGGIRGMWLSNAAFNTAQMFGSSATSGGITSLGQFAGTTSGFSGGTQGTTYTNIAVTGGTGTGAKVDVYVSSSGNIGSVSVSHNGNGSGYKVGDILSGAGSALGGSGTFTVPVIAISARNTPANTQSNKGWSASGEGYPAEILAYFCKYASPNLDFYYTLPAWEDGTNGGAGTYSNELLTMINNVLIPNGNNIILEIGNELWNGDYPVGVSSGYTINTLAVNSGIASGPTDYTGCWKYIGYRYHALANMCRTIFGSKFGTQVKIVLAGQSTAWGTNHAVALDYIDTTYGAGQAAQDIQYLSGACYSNLANNATDTSVALVLSDLSAQAKVHPYADDYEHGSILAGMRGQRLIAYEGPSWQVNAEPSGNSYIGAAIMDPGMEAVERDDITKPAFDAGCYKMFKFESGCSSGGGTYPPIDQWSDDYATLVSTGSPRYNAIIDLINTPYTPQRNVLSARGTTFTTAAWADNVGSASNPAQEYDLLGTGYYGNCMQVYVPAGMPGTYSMVLNVTTAGGSPVTTVLVNGTQVYNAAVSTGNNTISGITLSEGFNGIVIYTTAGNLLSTVNSIQLN